LERANFWLSKAANAGEPEAMKLLSELQLAQSSPDDAAAWNEAVLRLKTAAAAGNRDAALNGRTPGIAEQRPDYVGYAETQCTFVDL